MLTHTPRILGEDKLVSVFGYWPSFHDAEVVRMTLERGDADTGPILSTDIYVFEITPEVDPGGAYVLRHHTLASLRFGDVQELVLEDFNAQNAILGLAIRDIRDRQLEQVSYEVEFTAAYGVQAQFLCREAEVVSVRPWRPGMAAPVT